MYYMFFSKIAFSGRRNCHAGMICSIIYHQMQLELRSLFLNAYEVVIRGTNYPEEIIAIFHLTKTSRSQIWPPPENLGAPEFNDSND